MALVNELYKAVLIAANGTATLPAVNGVGGFLCTVSGTLNATEGGDSIISALGVTAGNFYPLGFAVNDELVVTLSGGAAGTLGVC